MDDGGSLKSGEAEKAEVEKPKKGGGTAVKPPKPAPAPKAAATGGETCRLPNGDMVKTADGKADAVLDKLGCCLARAKAMSGANADRLAKNEDACFKAHAAK